MKRIVVPLFACFVFCGCDAKPVEPVKPPTTQRPEPYIQVTVKADGSLTSSVGAPHVCYAIEPKEYPLPAQSAGKTLFMWVDGRQQKIVVMPETPAQNAQAVMVAKQMRNAGFTKVTVATQQTPGGNSRAKQAYY